MTTSMVYVFIIVYFVSLFRGTPTYKNKVDLKTMSKDSYTEIFLALLSCTRVTTHVDSSLTDLYTGY
jgi:hypothetical protein